MKPVQSTLSNQRVPSWKSQLKLISHHKYPFTINKQDYKLDRITSEPFSVRYWCRIHITYSYPFPWKVHCLLLRLRSHSFRSKPLPSDGLVKRYQRTSVLSTFSTLAERWFYELHYTIASQLNRNWKVLSLPRIHTNRTDGFLKHWFCKWLYPHMTVLVADWTLTPEKVNPIFLSRKLIMNPNA